MWGALELLIDVVGWNCEFSTNVRSNKDLRGELRDPVNKSAASAASLDYVKFQAVIKSAASAASLRGGPSSGRLDHGPFFRAILGRASGQKIREN